MGGGSPVWVLKDFLDNWISTGNEEGRKGCNEEEGVRKRLSRIELTKLQVLKEGKEGWRLREALLYQRDHGEQC